MYKHLYMKLFRTKRKVAFAITECAQLSFDPGDLRLGVADQIPTAVESMLKKQRHIAPSGLGRIFGRLKAKRVGLRDLGRHAPDRVR
jgi:hypothetical protein